MGEKAVGVKLRSVADLARLASSMAGMGSGIYIVHFAHEGKHYYGLLVTFRDYYKYYGIPIFYYVERGEPLRGKYLLIKVDESGEKVEESEGSRSGWICLPIVDLAEKPNFIDV
mgnify:FL=1